MHICVSEWGENWFRKWLVAYLAPSHYLNQCWVIVNRTLRNKLQWDFNQNKNIFTRGNASENIVWETVAILSRGRWVNKCTKCLITVMTQECPGISFYQLLECWINGLITLQAYNFTKPASMITLCWEFTDDLWIPCTKCRKCIHVMMSSGHQK